MDASQKIQNIPDTQLERVVIVGGGFAGLQLVRDLSNKDFQVVLIDRNNFHQFQPLFYQVATAGLEPSAISFPFRKIFQKKEHTHFRMAEALKIDSGKKILRTSIGEIEYDHLVLGMGATTNYFGNKNIESKALAMKSVGHTIITNVFLSILNLIEHGMSPQEAIDFPRFHHQWLPDLVYLEYKMADSTLISELSQKGHDVEIWNSIGLQEAIFINDSLEVFGVHDLSRGEGSAIGSNQMNLEP